MSVQNIKDEWNKKLLKEYNKTDDLSRDIKTLMEIIIYVSFGEKIGRLYKIIGNEELFSKIINEFGKCQIEFPSKEDFTESVMTAIIYYYKEVLNYDWIKIQNLLPYESDIGLRYNRKIDNLGQRIKKRLEQIERDKKIEVKEESLFS